ncbi:MAG: RagB/SusD family nutrient uptake outer membrane protein [Parafilimonas sp.]
MKKYCSIIFLIAASGLVISSCKKYYEDVPVEQIGEQYVWDPLDSNGTNARLYLNQIYSLLPTGFNRLSSDFLCSASDDAIPSRLSTDVRNMATGGINIFFQSNMDNTWNNDYAGIRKATIFLTNFAIVPLKDPNEKRYWFGEARVMRAMFYWELVRRWGGVPLLGDSVKTLEDDVEVSRNTFDECIQYIVSECNIAKDSLRPDPVDESNIGRWTQAGAMALKARVLLYAASARHNGENPGNELTGYTSYDVNRWKLAADAAREIMNLGVYQLDTLFKNIFISDRSVETIFAKTKMANHYVETNNGPPNIASAFANGYTSPTQELVDAFGMSNGRDITDPLSGYNPDSPYNNRDSRFYATILYNGAQWLSTPLQTYDGGFAKPGGTSTQTQTSYYLRKFMGNFENSTQYSDHYSDFIIFRYTEVLLNFAEAENEFAGPDADVYGAIDSIRRRAHLNPYLLDPGISQDSMRIIIRNERRKELAFEEHRYWDIRRWKIAGEVYNKDLHGMSISKNAAGDLTFNVVPVLTTVFDESRMYFYPIPYNEIVSNKNMVQNPGW